VLTSAFPWSLDEQQFQAPEHRQRDSCGPPHPRPAGRALETHGQDMPQSFGYLRAL